MRQESMTRISPGSLVWTLRGRETELRETFLQTLLPERILVHEILSIVVRTVPLYQSEKGGKKKSGRRQKDYW